MSRITGLQCSIAPGSTCPFLPLKKFTGRDAKYECCKFRGSLVALDAYTGKVLWKSFYSPGGAEAVQDKFRRDSDVWSLREGRSGQRQRLI